MGNSTSECNILICGLDNAGKSSFLQALDWGSIETKIPTIGCNVDMIKLSSAQRKLFKSKGLGPVSITTVDLIHKEEINFRLNTVLQSVVRGMCNAIVFIVDAQDLNRIDDEGAENRRTSSAKEILSSLLVCSPIFPSVPVLVMANKQDLANCASVVSLISRLDLRNVCGSERRWHVQGCSVTTGDGLADGMDWLVAELAK